MRLPGRRPVADHTLTLVAVGLVACGLLAGGLFVALERGEVSL